ncbi:cysteine proteinase inhibitor 1-like [Prunus avium]|uniref:Cysteine proteinase inhibitor 1-like n=1 Tax=Prunus avium TaxID=42229 RepID=A0A6P5TXA7_PRUAV|nr:cysteine proteinase inhibitor 1-like [Prunus avium]
MRIVLLDKKIQEIQQGNNSTVTMRPHCLLALVALVLPLVAAAATGHRDALVGGYQPIKNISDPHVKEIAEFAVSEYNKQAQGKNKLVFQRVIRGETQVVAGINFRLVISAKNESSEVSNPPTAAAAAGENYVAGVWEKSWEHFRQLISFRKLAETK